MGAAETLLTLRGVRRSYPSGDGEVEVLHGIDLEIRRGEMVAIIGPSGSGKSTLMNIIGCLDAPTGGSYEVGGQDTSAMLPDELAQLRRDFFGFIFQRYHLLGHLSASENVQVPSIYAGVRPQRRAARASDLLGRLGLSEREGYRPSQLSGGQQQRVSIARALMNGGQIILADEPTGALDTKSGEEVMRILSELNAEGHTVIIVTHDPRIARCARRIITIRDGTVVSDEQNPEAPKAAPAAPGGAEAVINNSWAHTWRSLADRFYEAFVMASRAMRSNRLRTLLTMLGIIIGIMAVVSVVALGRGASERIISNISALGTNTLTVYPGTHMGDVRSGKHRTLTVRDLQVLEGQPFVDSATSTLTRSVLIRQGNKESDGTAYGVTTNYFRVYGMEIEAGRLFNEREERERSQVAVIDSNTASSLFGATSPVGRKLLLNTLPVTVVGVLKKTDSPFMREGQLMVYLPYTSVMSRLMNQNYLSSIVLRIKDGFSAAVAEKSLKALLTTRHGRVDFFVMSSDTIMRSINETTQTFTLLISAIAVISLLVGGIGVMNIMLVSVTERTREIGIRMAVGARQADIMAQFLIESVLVCLMGGFLGVVLSFLMGQALGYLAPGIAMSFSVFSIVAAVVTSSLIGIAFGFMPARSAARLNPIEALARE
ncbi:MAG: MacB family efflux pump subunit [Succinivibrionaceae bacterium]|nr:MacB family efflux pump subunit [Succinivibrionaceae bacterium]